MPATEPAWKETDREVKIREGDAPLECAIFDPWDGQPVEGSKFPEYGWKARATGGDFRLIGGKGLRAAIEGAAVRTEERPLRVRITRTGSGATGTRWTAEAVL